MATGEGLSDAVLSGITVPIEALPSYDVENIFRGLSEEDVAALRARIGYDTETGESRTYDEVAVVLGKTNRDEAMQAVLAAQRNLQRIRPHD